MFNFVMISSFFLSASLFVICPTDPIYFRLTLSFFLPGNVHPVLEEVVLRSVSPFANTELWVLPFPARHALSTLSRWNWRHGDDISYDVLELPHKKPTL